jgi:hypothetical protein
MRKSVQILVVIFILCFGGYVHAQQKGSLWVNVVSGLNSSLILNQNAYGNPEMAYKPTFGFTGGLGVTYFHSYDWGYSGSLLISKLGQNYNGMQAGAEAERKVKLLYLEVPLLIMKKFTFLKKPTWVSFGPDLMFLLNAKQEYSRDGGTPLPNPEGMASGDVKDRYKSADVAIDLSLSRMYGLDYSGKYKLLFSLNTAIGITDINTPEWQIPNTHGEYGKSHNFYIGMKVALMIKSVRFGGGYW